MQFRNIVIVGGGFAGTAIMRRLMPQLPEGWRAILVSEENYMLYTPLLPEVVGASLLPAHSVAPLRRIVKRSAYLRGAVTNIEFDRQLVHYQERVKRELPYDHLVLACGTMANLDLIPGMAEHGVALKTLGDALHLRNLMIERLEQADVESDRRTRRKLTRFFVIGGGSSGIEVAGVMQDFLNAASQHYSRIEPEDLEVILVESGGRLVPEFPRSLDAFAARALENAGVRIHLNVQVTRVSDSGIQDQHGRWFDGHNVVCTVGTSPRPLVDQLPFQKHSGRLVTAPDLSIPGAEGLWAVGDCAAVPNRATGEVSPPTAQFAVRHSKQVVTNVLRRINNQKTRPFSYRSRGVMACVGYHRAVVSVFGLKWSGFTAWLLWRIFYLFKLPTLLRKLQVCFEWNIEMVFPQDVTQLHFERTRLRRR